MTELTTSTTVVNWAILGTGAIANDMVQILKQLPHCNVLAVGSRTVAGANRFGDRWGIPRQYGSYEEAASDKDVDICYIATPSLRHPQDCLLAIKNGKAVLCEKSMAPNDTIAKEIFNAANEANVLCVHGVWSPWITARAPCSHRRSQRRESSTPASLHTSRAFWRPRQTFVWAQEPSGAL